MMLKRFIGQQTSAILGACFNENDISILFLNPDLWSVGIFDLFLIVQKLFSNFVLTEVFAFRLQWVFLRISIC
jgi:hypothetical protein